MTDYVPGFSRKAFEKIYWKPDTHPGLSLFRFFQPKKGAEKSNQKEVDRLKKLSPGGSDVLLKRRRAHLEELSRVGFRTRSWVQVTASRLVCGMGIDTTLENGLLLDRIFGLPYIPGSSLKGVALDEALKEKGVFSDREKRRNEKRCSGDIMAVFGSQGPEPKQTMDAHWEPGRGHVIFFDALPVFRKNQSLFSTDIINSHYGDYYQDPEKKVPADYMKPNPIFFLAVNKGIRFCFALAARPVQMRFKLPDGTIQTVEKNAEQLCEMAGNWVQNALENSGIGAKTRVGYGYFHTPASDTGKGCA